MLVQALKDQDEGIRQEAALTLGRVGPAAREAIPALLEAMKDKNKLMRRNAIIGLSCIEHQEKVAAAVIAAVDDPADEVAVEACLALSWPLLSLPHSLGGSHMLHTRLKIPADVARPVLLRKLGTGTDPVKIAAAMSLYNADYDAFLTTAIPVLFEVVRKNKPSQHDWDKAAQVIRWQKMGFESKRKAIVPLLCRHLKDEDWLVRCTAADALEFGPEAKEAVPHLIEALADDNINVCQGAARALGAMHADAEAAVPALIRVLKDSRRSYAASYAALALGNIGPKARPAVPLLLEMLKGKNVSTVDDTATSAAWALGGIGTDAKDVVPALVAVLVPENEYSVRVNAARSLGSFGAQARPAIPALLERINSDTWYEMFTTSARTLKSIGPDAAEKATAALLKRLGKDDNFHTDIVHAIGVADIDGKNVPTLVRLLREDGKDAHAAAFALGEIGPRAKDAVPALLKAAENQNSHFRAVARAALEKIDPVVKPK